MFFYLSLHDGPNLLDRIEVRTVGRVVEQFDFVFIEPVSCVFRGVNSCPILLKLPLTCFHCFISKWEHCGLQTDLIFLRIDHLTENIYIGLTYPSCLWTPIHEAFIFVFLRNLVQLKLFPPHGTTFRLICLSVR